MSKKNKQRFTAPIRDYDEPVETKTFVKEETQKVIYYRNAHALNVRKGPSTSDFVIFVAPSNSRFVIVEELGEWSSIEVEMNGHEIDGFVMTRFLIKE